MFCNDGANILPLHRNLYLHTANVILVKYLTEKQYDFNLDIKYIKENVYFVPKHFDMVNKCPEHRLIGSPRWICETLTESKKQEHYTLFNLRYLNYQYYHFLFFSTYKLFSVHSIKMFSSSSILYSLHAAIKPSVGLETCSTHVNTLEVYREAQIRVVFYESKLFSNTTISISGCGSEVTSGGAHKGGSDRMEPSCGHCDAH